MGKPIPYGNVYRVVNGARAEPLPYIDENWNDGVGATFGRPHLMA